MRTIEDVETTQSLDNAVDTEAIRVSKDLGGNRNTRSAGRLPVSGGIDHAPREASAKQSR